MVKTLRESKAKLSELVELASQGEDVLITVRGKVKARLTGVDVRSNQAETKAWLDELRALREAHTIKQTLTIQQIIDENREDRF